jgi:hypothetical protein
MMRYSSRDPSHWLDRFFVGYSVAAIVLVGCSLVWPGYLMPYGILLFPVITAAAVIGALWSAFGFPRKRLLPPNES